MVKIAPNQTAFPKSVAIVSLLVAILLLIYGVIQISRFDSTPQIVNTSHNDAIINISITPGAVLLPGDEIRLSWDISGIQSIYLNESGKIGTYEEPSYPDQCTGSYAFDITSQDGSTTTYPFTVYVLFLDSSIWLRLGAAVLLLLLAGYIIPIPLLSRPSNRAATLLNIRQKYYFQNNRVLLLRLGLFAGAALLFYYYSLPLCLQSIQSFSDTHPLNVAVYMAFMLCFVVLLALSLWKPAAILRYGRLALIRTPTPTLLGLVFSVWWLMFELIWLWGYHVSAVNVLSLVVVFAATGFSVLMINLGDKQQRPESTVDDAHYAHTQPLPLRKYTTLAVLLASWIFLWRFPWQTMAGDWYWARALISLLMFIVPGALLQRYVYRQEPTSIIRAITVGFAASIGLNGVLVLFACILQLPHTFITDALFIIGAALLAHAILRGDIFHWEGTDGRKIAGFLAIASIALIAIAIAAEITYASQVFYRAASDMYVYNAYVTEFANSEAYGFTEIFLGTGNIPHARFWLMYWPAFQAVIVNLSELHIFALWPVLTIYLCILSLLNVYELARTLKFSRPLSWLAVVAQVFALSLLLIDFAYARKAGSAFFWRILEDKASAAFIIATCLFRVCIDLFEEFKWRKLLLFGLIAAGFMFTHPTILAITSLIIGLYALLEVVFERKLKTMVGVGTILAACMLPFFMMRIVPNSPPTTIDAVMEAGEATDIELEYRLSTSINIMEDDRFYGILPLLIDGPAYALFFAGGTLAVLQLRRSKAARLIVAATGIILLAVFPYTGWLLGAAISPFQLQRIPWLAPFGISISFIVLTLNNFFPNIFPRAKSLVARWSILALGLVMLGVMLLSLQQEERLITSARTKRGDVSGWSDAKRLDELAELALQVDEILTEPTVTFSNRGLQNDLSALSANVNVILFHGHTSKRTGVTEEEVAIREIDYAAFFEETTTDEERFNFLDTYGVELVIQKGTGALAGLIDRHPERFRFVGEAGRYSLHFLIH